MGVDIYLHWSWWMMLVFLLVAAPLTAGVFVGLFAIITLHELGHCWAAKKSGVVVDSVMLYITGGVMRSHGVDTKNELFIKQFCSENKRHSKHDCQCDRC